MVPRLLYLITNLEYGGAQTGAVRLIHEIDNHYDVDVVSLKPKLETADQFPDSVTVETLDVTSHRQIHRLFKLVPRVRNADLLVNSLYHAAFLGSVFGYLTGTPTLTWQHRASYRSKKNRKGFELAYRLSDRVLADSPSTAQFLTDKIGISSNHVATVTLAGIDTDQFQPGDKELSNDRPLVVSVGRLVDEKGWDFLNDVAQFLPFDFEIAGSGPLSDELRADAPANVTFRGFVEELPQFLKRGDVYFQPSRTEGLCITALEAMASGLPIVASAIAGLSDTVKDGVNGYLVPVGDVNAYRDALRAAVERPELGEAGRRKVVERYNRDALRDDFLAVARPFI